MGRFIIAYKGTIDNLPEGWLICNGENGTPDLRDRFIRGAYSNTVRGVGTTGGNINHMHIAEETSVTHSHVLQNTNSHAHRGTTSSEGGRARDSSGDRTDEYNTHGHTTGAEDMPHTHSISNVDIRPPFYRLIYLMYATDLYQAFNVPIGSIMIWTGAINDLPHGWVFCDGNNGTPDLRDRFIRGAYSDITRKVGTIGGSATHSHSLSSTGHSHTSNAVNGSHLHRPADELQYDGGMYVYSSGKGYYVRYAGSSHSHTTDIAGTHTHAIEPQSEILPPFYNMAYIKKVA